MKKILILCLLDMLTISIWAQLRDTVPRVGVPLQSSDLLFEKARKQKTTGWIFLGGGAGLAIAGMVVGESIVNRVGRDPIDKISSNLETGGALALIGTASMLGSIPFFIASGKNRKKATVMIDKESNSFLQQLHLNGNRVSVGIRLNL